MESEEREAKLEFDLRALEINARACVFAQPLASRWTAECQRTVFLTSGRPNLRQPLSSVLSALRSRLSG